MPQPASASARGMLRRPAVPAANSSRATAARKAVLKRVRSAEITTAGTRPDSDPIRMLLSAHKNAEASAADSPTSLLHFTA